MAPALSDPSACWLALDASTYGGTVAVLRGGVVVAEREVAMRGEREERLMLAVVDALAAAGVAPSALAGVVCGAGPGSFTSLRIAASIAKGIAHAAGVPLLAAPSLALLVAGGRQAPAAGRYLATMDALRGESYAALVTVAATDGGATRGGATVVGYEYLGVVPTDALRALASARDAVHVQPSDPQADGDPIAPRARGVAALGRLLADAGAVDLDAWEPDYGRKAEAQVKWEAAHGRALPTDAATLVAEPAS